MIHSESHRFAGPFRVIDCSTISEGLLEVELFGAFAGAFTDLDEDRPGLLAPSEGGTVLFDEIADVPLPMQGKLLRVLSEGAVRPLSARRTIDIDVRFLFSTSRDLKKEVSVGRLREDLFHRINVMAIRLPCLRERREDIHDLVSVFLRERTRNGPTWHSEVIDYLREPPWPGNVRELRNLVWRLTGRVSTKPHSGGGAGSHTRVTRAALPAPNTSFLTISSEATTGRR